MPMSPNRKFITESCKDIEKLYELVSNFCATSKAQLVIFRRVAQYKYKRVLTAWKNNRRLDLTSRGSEQYQIVYVDYTLEHPCENEECVEKRISKYLKS